MTFTASRELRVLCLTASHWGDRTTDCGQEAVIYSHGQNKEPEEGRTYTHELTSKRDCREGRIQASDRHKDHRGKRPTGHTEAHSLSNNNAIDVPLVFNSMWSPTTQWWSVLRVRTSERAQQVTRHLLPSLMTHVQSLGPKQQKDTTDSHKLNSDHHNTRCALRPTPRKGN